MPRAPRPAAVAQLPLAPLQFGFPKRRVLAQRQMYLSRLPLNTFKESPADAEIVSHQLMLRAGLIRRLASGIYSWLPLGMRVLHTATPPLANGSSQPSIFNIASNLKALGYTPCIDLKPLEAVTKHFTYVAHKDGLPIGKPVEYDQSQYGHQVPGGMISNMRHQLKIDGMEDKMEAALEESARVRAEFGYPIMVTPLSQFVGSQAAINVIVGERYKEVTDQSIEYAMGIWGKEGAALMDSNVKDRILHRPRAAEIAERPHPSDSLQDLRRKYGGAGVSDEEVLMRFFSSKEDVERMRAAGPARNGAGAGTDSVGGDHLLGGQDLLQDAQHARHAR